MAANPELRVATLAEATALDALMKDSIRELFPRYYDARQTESSERYIGAVDRLLIVDGTYFVAPAEGEPVACGGWSKRDKLFTGTKEADPDDIRLLDPATEAAHVRAMFVRADWTRRGLGTRILEASETAAREEGFRTLNLMATLPGVPLYERYGFVAVREDIIRMPDGVEIASVEMEKPVEGAG